MKTAFGIVAGGLILSVHVAAACDCECVYDGTGGQSASKQNVGGASECFSACGFKADVSGRPVVPSPTTECLRSVSAPASLCPPGSILTAALPVDYCASPNSTLPAKLDRGNNAAMLGIHGGVSCINDVPLTVTSYQVWCHAYTEQVFVPPHDGYCPGMGTSSCTGNIDNFMREMGITCKFPDHYQICVYTNNQDHGTTLHFELVGEKK